MPELRKDPIIGRWVIISTERARRPDQFSSGVEKEELAPGEKCPFCEGNEDMTPPEIMALRKPGSRANTPGWDVRVIPYKFPLLRPEGDMNRHGHGMYDIMDAIGAHEIVIETPDHLCEGMPSAGQLTKVFTVVIDRIANLEKDPRIKYVLIVKNYGRAAGGGHIKHQRLQLIGTPVNLKRVKGELAGAKQYYDYKDRCIFCDIIKQEQAAQVRVVMESKYFIAIMPFASRFPFETWILPKEHSCDFYKTPKDRVGDFADLVSQTFGKLKKVIGDFPYNIVLHSAPFRRDLSKRRYWGTIDKDYHWHFEILPILTRVAGFEWGSGFYINPLSPEDACKSVKEAKVQG